MAAEDRTSPRTVEVAGASFRYAGITIRSGIPLPELPAVEDGRDAAPSFTFTIADSAPAEPPEDAWRHHWLEGEGRPTLSLSRAGDRAFLRFPGLADFDVSADGSAITAWQPAPTSADTIRHLLLDQVLPRLLAHRGRFVLHAAGVRVGNRAVAVLGDTHAGKSSLAASFHTAGFPVLSDDGLVLEMQGRGVRAVPTYAGLRLWPDAIGLLPAPASPATAMSHYSAKKRVAIGGPAAAREGGYALAALYVLVPGESTGASGVVVTPLTPREACLAMIGQAFQLDPTDRRAAAACLAAAGNVSERVPAFTVAYPRDFARLPDVRTAILNRLDTRFAECADAAVRP